MRWAERPKLEQPQRLLGFSLTAAQGKWLGQTWIPRNRSHRVRRDHVAARGAVHSKQDEESPQRQATATQSQQSILSFGVTTVYWERQGGGAMCAMHAINSLLQRPATTRERLHAIAGKLDERKRFLLHGNEPGEGGNHRPDGDYTIQVILGALEEIGEGWTLSDTRNPGVRDDILRQTHLEEGYLFRPGGHWYAVRKITQGVAQAWYSLDSLDPAGPQRITPNHLQQLLLTIERNGGYGASRTKTRSGRRPPTAIRRLTSA